MKLECEDCGILDFVEVNDHTTGAIFRFYQNRSVKVRPEDADCFHGLDREKKTRIREIREYVLEGEEVKCPKCKTVATVE